MPQTEKSNPSDPSILGAQTLCGYYSDAKKLYEHQLEGGRLISTKIFLNNGTLLHELQVQDGVVRTSVNWNEEGKMGLKLNLDIGQLELGFHSEEYD
jgi:hypothetical protein